MIYPVRGRLHPFSDMGTEGIFWCILEDDKNGYDGLVSIEEGDYLTIFKANGYPDWEGTIKWEWLPDDRQKQGIDHVQTGFTVEDWHAYFHNANTSELVKADIRSPEERFREERTQYEK